MSTKLYLSSLVPVFFAIGLWKGWQISDAYRHAAKLRLLTIEDCLAHEVREQFARQFKSDLIVDVVKLSDFEAALTANKYDLAILISQQLTNLQNAGRLAPLSTERISNAAAVNADFFHYNPRDQVYGVPLYWRVVPVPNSAKSQLLIYHLSALNTDNLKAANNLINFLLTKEVIVLQAQLKKLATTSNLAEDSAIDDGLKASALRKLNLQNTAF